MRAVLLAAGEGKRLWPHFKRPKPLVRLFGLPLIERNILSLRECGINDFIIVTGCYADEIQAHLGSGEKLGVKIKYLYNADWKLGNGLSAYTFHKEYQQDEKFILLMSDHIFELDLFKSFIAGAREIKEDELLLAADRRLENVYDLDECTRIKAQENLAVKLGKGLEDFNTVDCGLFIGTGALLEALSKSIAGGAYALTDAVNLMAEHGKVKLHFINNNWVDVDDYDSYKQCEKLLLKSLIPPKDGIISRVINRKVSLRITKLVAPTGITPNQITFLSFLITVASAVSFAMANPLVGGLLAQFASMLDGVDGEIARLKFFKSKFGEMFDSILDRYGDYLIVIGMTFSWYSTTNHNAALLVGAAALTGMPMSMLFKEKYRNVFGQPFISEVNDGVMRYFAANRDVRLFIIMLGGIFALLPATLIFLAVITHLQTLYRLYRVHKLP
ncbi:Nucleotidyl transferase [anaerobic digester metagenome]|jgi:choline kinase/phosphatidylglycerophosphate synthase|uniref:Bifunctional IPC transferase and DIPP synthase n=1 Tax=anaerobic digester metagenome TaxID=1263854 RepID=A0A485LWR5_9ZZZZ